MDISVVLFDLGGVLVKLNGPEALMRLSGYSKSREEVRSAWRQCSAVKEFETGRINLNVFAERVIRDLDLPVSLGTFLQDYPTWMNQLHSEAIDVLEMASQRCRIAALSNISAVHWRELESALTEAPVFEHTVLSFDTGWMKPERGAYLAAIERLGEPPDQVLFLDDSEANVVQARRMGMRAEQARNADEAGAMLRNLFSNRE
ncbi:haloacid dehalogenase [Saccharospirillum salsuginis]|uniref:Haloacid dehalogenase n=1 Tax=Saccharospirillum salsuginis TaxID=418750 RepID=A0A918KKN0_9GAMM|nr:haloacid dehalogenase [Saccharospirillum salsuginis]